MNDDLKKEVLEVMSRHWFCTLSTVTQQSKPQSAIVGFSHSDSLELLIGTSNQSRKFTNLQNNPHVAVVIGDQQAEIQYEGTARPLERKELEEHLQTQFAKLPGTDKYLKDPSQAWFLISPTWLRLTVHETQDRIEEMRQFA